MSAFKHQIFSCLIFHRFAKTKLFYLFFEKLYYVNIKLFSKLIYRNSDAEYNDTTFGLFGKFFADFLRINEKTVFGPKVNFLHN